MDEVYSFNLDTGVDVTSQFGESSWKKFSKRTSLEESPRMMVLVELGQSRANEQRKGG